MTIWYNLYTEEQGWIGEVSVEVNDATEEDIIDYITEDLNFRQEDWGEDRISGEYKGDVYFPYED